MSKWCNKVNRVLFRLDPKICISVSKKFYDYYHLLLNAKDDNLKSQEMNRILKSQQTL